MANRIIIGMSIVLKEMRYISTSAIDKKCLMAMKMSGMKMKIV